MKSVPLMLAGCCLAGTLMPGAAGQVFLLGHTQEQAAARYSPACALSIALPEMHLSMARRNLCLQHVSCPSDQSPATDMCSASQLCLAHACLQEGRPDSSKCTRTQTSSGKHPIATDIGCKSYKQSPSTLWQEMHDRTLSSACQQRPLACRPVSPSSLLDILSPDRSPRNTQSTAPAVWRLLQLSSCSSSDQQHAAGDAALQAGMLDGGTPPSWQGHDACRWCALSLQFRRLKASPADGGLSCTLLL